MSVEAIAVVLNHSKAKGTHKLVLVGIANHHGESGAWPSIHTLTRYTNMSERRVQQSIKALEELGELEVEVRGGAGYGKYKTNRYWIKIACPPDCSGFGGHSQAKPASGDNLGVQPASFQSEARFGLEVQPATAKPLREPLSKPNKTSDEVAEQFEEFWNAYPKAPGHRTERKNDARIAFKAALKTASYQEILDGAIAYSKLDKENRFKLIAVKWLRNELWKESYPESKPVASFWNRESR
jgi:biotin operon repressor